ncbi:hypothetical protein BC829DRAFT_488270 [Chytridium lagenaria]|nr:hypothetical protein BC829DRAFT_488270 [Chytridium lagenaria]
MRIGSLSSDIMHLSNLPQDVLSFYLVPVLNDKDCLLLAGVNKQLRLACLPFIIRVIRSNTEEGDPFTITRTQEIPRALHIFKSSPNVAFHVREVELTQQSHLTVSEARELLSLIGERLERLTLCDLNFGGKSGGIGGFFVEALKLCPNLKGVKMVVGEVSSDWWRSGGKEELTMAIAALPNLVSLSASCGMYDWERGYGGEDNGPDFTSTMLTSLKAGQLTECLTVISCYGEPEQVVRQAVKQNAVKELDLLLYVEARREDLISATTHRFFSDFHRLETLNVTLAGFTFMSSAFAHLYNLRHLVIGSLYWQDHDVFINLHNVVTSGAFCRLESLCVFSEDCHAGDAECDFFRLLGNGNALKRFELICSDHSSSDALNDILDGMTPNPNLENVHIVFYMTDTTLLHFSRFIAGCENLQDLDLIIRNRHYGFLMNEADSHQFLSDIMSAPNLAVLTFNLPMTLDRLKVMDRYLSDLPLEERRLKNLKMKSDKDMTVFNQLHVFLENQSTVTSLEINMEDCGDHFSENLIPFFETLIVHQPSDLKSLTFCDFQESMRDDNEKVFEDMRRCYGVVELFASTCERLEVLHFYGMVPSEVEMELMKRVLEARVEAGLGALDFCIRYEQ